MLAWARRKTETCVHACLGVEACVCVHTHTDVCITDLKPRSLQETTLLLVFPPSLPPSLGSHRLSFSPLCPYVGFSSISPQARILLAHPPLAWLWLWFVSALTPGYPPHPPPPSMACHHCCRLDGNREMVVIAPVHTMLVIAIHIVIAPAEICALSVLYVLN